MQVSVVQFRPWAPRPLSAVLHRSPWRPNFHFFSDGYMAFAGSPFTMATGDDPSF
jgi:hypothetical protein